jgi:hypothetical protein
MIMIVIKYLLNTSCLPALFCSYLYLAKCLSPTSLSLSIGPEQEGFASATPRCDWLVVGSWMREEAEGVWEGPVSIEFCTQVATSHPNGMSHRWLDTQV